MKWYKIGGNYIKNKIISSAKSNVILQSRISQSKLSNDISHNSETRDWMIMNRLTLFLHKWTIEYWDLNRQLWTAYKTNLQKIISVTFCSFQITTYHGWGASRQLLFIAFDLIVKNPKLKKMTSRSVGKKLLKSRKAGQSSSIITKLPFTYCIDFQNEGEELRTMTHLTTLLTNCKTSRQQIRLIYTMYYTINADTGVEESRIFSKHVNFQNQSARNKAQ